MHGDYRIAQSESVYQVNGSMSFFSISARMPQNQIERKKGRDGVNP